LQLTIILNIRSQFLLQIIRKIYGAQAQIWKVIVMLRSSRIGTASLVTLMGAFGIAHAEDDPESTNPALNNIDILTVVGSARSIQDVAGSVSYIPPEKLEVQNYTDINRILRQVPGINIQEDDGYGLRPNIGLRGSGLDRSAKVLIMEDGVLLAPAPYSAPAAYYFPFSARMNAIEVTKGPSTVKYGPFTTAGAIQFFSTPIPDDAAAQLTFLTSNQNRSTVHAWTGGKFAVDQLPFDIGLLFETYQDKAQGFKEIEGDPNADTGFSLQDYVAKFGLFSKDNASTPQSLVFKFQYSEQRGNETYLGLTEGDIRSKPFIRYRASRNDQINTKHYTYQLTHNIQLSDNFQLTTIAYNTDFARNWEKLDRFDNSNPFFTGGVNPLLSGTGACNSLDEILLDPLSCPREFQVLKGPAGFVSPDDVLGIRQNKRSYYTYGVQTAANIDFNTMGLDHNMVVSARYHEDAVDRFQEQDQYRIDNGAIVRTTDNAPGTQSNRLAKSTALSLYVEDTIYAGPVAITGGIRFESVDTRERRWNTPDRTLTPDRIRENSYDVFLPSLSMLVDITDDFSLLAGAHRGFAPASVSSQTQKPEESIAYEAGGRYAGDAFNMEVIGFFNDYSNLVAECTNSTGGSECEIGDTNNAGAVDVYGIEVVASTDLAKAFSRDIGLAFPLSLTYTYTDTNFKSSVASGIFGDITIGDEAPYVPDHQIYLSAGVNGAKWGVNADLSYVSEARAVPGQGLIPTLELIDARTIVDLSAQYEIRKGVRLRLKVENLFDEYYVAARRPYGARPGKPREIFGGITIDL
jgi:Fe(3+) dicitrate transport protein